MNTKTFVTDDYQVSFTDDGGIMVLFEEENTRIIYNESYRDPWWIRGPHNCSEAKSLGELGLSRSQLEKLYEALKLADKQYLMGDVVLMDKEKKEEPEDKVEKARNANYSEVKVFKGCDQASCFEQINTYAKENNLRIASISAPDIRYDHDNWAGLSYHYYTVVFDRM